MIVTIFLPIAKNIFLDPYPIQITDSLMAAVWLSNHERTLDSRGGFTFAVIGTLLHQASRSEIESFFRWTVHVRSKVVLFIIAFVVLGFSQPMLILFGVVDLFSAADICGKAPKQNAVHCRKLNRLDSDHSTHICTAVSLFF